MRLARTWIALAGLALATAALAPAVVAPPARAGDSDAVSSPQDVAAAVDRALAAAWERDGIEPAPRCSDAEFVRRVHLDVVGTIPTALQVEEFLKDARPDKRARLVEDLLGSPGWARHMTNRWSDVLVGAGTGDTRRDFVPGLFVQWMETQFATDRPFAAWVGDLITAQGTGYSNAAANFTARKDTNPADLAGAVSKVFLGVQIQCAQCHDHPYEADLKQADFEAFSAFWGRLLVKPADIPYEMFGPEGVRREQARFDKNVQDLVKAGVPEAEAKIRAERQRLRTKEVTDLAGDARVPRALTARRRNDLGPAAHATPKFLRGATYQDRAGETRRQALAAWITDPANPFTARTLANRTWSWFLGRGIVHPADDFNSTNPPAVPEALDVLARDTAAHAFDLKRLVRIITATRAYQTSTVLPRSVASKPEARPGDRAAAARSAKAQATFASGPLKPLTAQQSFDSLGVALGIHHDGRALTISAAGPTAVEMGDGRGGMMRMAMDAADGYEQPDRARAAITLAARSFFQTFDDDEDNADATFEGTVPQGLFLLNSRVVNTLLQDARISVVPRIVATWPDEASRVRQLFLRTLSREPTPAESARFVKFVRAERPETSASGDGEGDGGGRGRGARARRGREAAEAAAPYADALWVLVSCSEFGSNH